MSNLNHTGPNKSPEAFAAAGNSDAASDAPSGSSVPSVSAAARNPELGRKFTLGKDITDEQKEFYHKYGFVVFSGVFFPEQIAIVTEELEKQKKLVADSGKTEINGVPIKFGIDKENRVIPQRTPFMNLLSPVIDRLVRDPRLEALLQFIPDSRFGYNERDGVVINHYVAGGKSKFKKLGWHTDSIRDIFYLEKVRPMLNVGIHVSPSSATQGGLRIIPGTHNQSIWKLLTGKLHIIGHAPDPNELIVNVAVGDLTIHDGRLWHRAAGPTQALGHNRKTIYFPILCGPYSPKNENSKPPFYLRFMTNVKPKPDVKDV
ncbi:MAG: phytanoyl-CoA dioxygenase family protein [Methylotenera sp.]|nr:phytanoyl-CoA dioxygenase family protein [Oligoflexia bacterium]